MTYFYAGLGVVMLTGIMALFEMGLSLTGQSLFPVSENPYGAHPTARLREAELLSILNDPAALQSGLRGAVLCREIQRAYRQAYRPERFSNYFVEDSRSLPDNWQGSCRLNDSNHRLIVRPLGSSPSSPYRLYSCVLEGQTLCPFEGRVMF